ncbi:MAG TPA: amidohydrolase family protein [Gemmatimonadaceae bacterium]|nr:amidohydrolase family protein [Gemmatimonadaceae bacterium]
MLGFALLFAVFAADTTSYVVLNHGRPAGEMLVIGAGDSVVVKYHHYDRQRGPRSETRYRMRNGVVIGGETWQLPLYGPEPTPRPAPNDRFEVVRDSVFWRVRDSVRGAPFAPGSYYRLRSQTPYDQALLARYLLGRRDRSANLLPGGTARVEIVADTTVMLDNTRQRVRLAMIHGARGNPFGAWIDDRGELVAGESGWFITVKRGQEHILPALRALEIRYRNARGADLARRVAPKPATSVAIVNGNLFDSEQGIMLPKRTIVVQGDRIVAVGRADSVAIPAGAVVVDATDKTVMPGMWDMHTHAGLLSQSTSGPNHLAIGVTTIRDLAADLDIATQLRDRADKGEVLAPRLILGGFIEGPGHWAGPSEAIATTEKEARAWVARYDSLGYKQVKLYNLVQQDLVPAVADETHKRGMRLSGHVPRGLSTPAAVRLGFDEINHAAFLFSTFFPDSLYIPQMRAYSTVSQIVAPNVDVDGPQVTEMIQLFKERGTVIDGTWNLWMSSRGPVAAGVGIPQVADATAQRLDANYLRMLKRLYDAGVPIVAGTDGSSYNVELELYERAGIPANEVLRIATIGAARVMKDDARYGSIAPGKVADIIIINGKPAERVADLRKVERVMRAGRLYDVRAIRDAQ